MVRDINSKLDKVISEQSDLRKSIESRLTNLEKSQSDKTVNECKNIRDEMCIEITKVNDNFKSVESHLKDYQDKMKNEVGDSQARVETIESPLHSIQKEPYHADVTVVLRYCETENILAKAQSLVHDGLQETLPVVHTMHTPHRDGKPGIVKIEFQSLDDKVRALRAKSKLSENSQYRRVFVRSSQTHTERVLHQNTMTTLKEMGVDQKFRFTGSGRLSLTPATPHPITVTAYLLHQTRPAHLFHLKDSRLSKPIRRCLFISMPTTRENKSSTGRIQLPRGMHHRSTLATSRAWCRCLTIPHTHNIIQVRFIQALIRRRWRCQRTLPQKISNLQYNSRPNPPQLARLTCSIPNPAV